MIDLLQPRIGILIAKHKYTFSTSLNDYQLKLKEEFNEEYTQDEIETALQEIENNYLEHVYNTEKEGVVLQAKDDFELTQLITV